MMNSSKYIQEDHFISHLTYCSAPLGDHVISFFEVRHDFYWRNPYLSRPTFIIEYWSPLSSSSANEHRDMYENCRSVMDSVSVLLFIGTFTIRIFGWFWHELRHALGKKEKLFKTCIWKKKTTLKMRKIKKRVIEFIFFDLWIVSLSIHSHLSKLDDKIVWDPSSSNFWSKRSEGYGWYVEVEVEVGAGVRVGVQVEPEPELELDPTNSNYSSSDSSSSPNSGFWFIGSSTSNQTVVSIQWAVTKVRIVKLSVWIWRIRANTTTELENTHCCLCKIGVKTLLRVTK